MRAEVIKSKYPVYPAYHETGIEWLGSIPKHWEEKKLKWLLKEKLKYGANEIGGDDNGDFPRYIRITDFGEDGKLRSDTFKSLPVEKAKDYLLEEGDILFARSGATVGKTYYFHNYTGKACFAGYLIKATPNASIIDSNYLFFFTKTNYYENWRNSIFDQATIQNIAANKYQALSVCLPSLKEQKQIVEFLDKKTGQIDQLINIKKKLISKLRERRSAIINQAVTKGLDPNVPLEDSGIDWLGSIPKHWEVKKLKWLLKEKLKYGANEIGGDDNVDFPRYIRITDFGENGKLRSDTFKSLPPEKAKDYLLEEGDILFARSGATVGKTYYFHNFKGKACFAGYLIKATSDKNIIDSNYLFFFTKTNYYENWKNSIFDQATIQNISANKYQALNVCLPSLKEQEKIVTFLDEKTGQIDRLIEKENKNIHLLEEYRQRLISDAVTGKIDVRYQVHSNQHLTLEDVEQ